MRLAILAPALTGTVAALAASAALGASEGQAPGPAAPLRCLSSGDGYFRARLAGAVEATVDWRNDGTRCEGEPKYPPPGIRLSFQHAPAGGPDLLFVIGLAGVVEGRAAHEVGANLTVIVQGTDRFYGTQGYTRCTVDTLTQRRVGKGRSYRVEARGFCTQPAHAVRGEGGVLVSTFEFAGLVNYEPPKDEAPN